MAALPLIAPSLAGWHDDHVVPDELIGRLHRAGENAVLDLTATFTPRQRASLAAYCYRKAHLHGIGLAIAATCDQATLIQAFGTALGTALFAQSRERVVQPVRAPSGHRAKITLATFTPRAASAAEISFDDEIDDLIDDVVEAEPASESIAVAVEAAV